MRLSVKRKHALRRKAKSTPECVLYQDRQAVFVAPTHQTVRVVMVVGKLGWGECRSSIGNSDYLHLIQRGIKVLSNLSPGHTTRNVRNTATIKKILLLQFLFLSFRFSAV